MVYGGRGACKGCGAYITRQGLDGKSLSELLDFYWANQKRLVLMPEHEDIQP